MYVVQDTLTDQLIDFNGRQIFATLHEAKSMLAAHPSGYEIRRLAELSYARSESSPLTKDPQKTSDDLPPYLTPEIIASQIDVKKGAHVLICGEVQIGKLRQKLELTRLLIDKHKKCVLLLFRNNNTDLSQFTKRLDEFNREQRTHEFPVLPQPMDILSHSHSERLPELLKDPNLILGLANTDTFSHLARCLNDRPELGQNLTIILDEADLVTFELEGDQNRTKTEDALRDVFQKIFMLTSVTGTPGSILLSDKMSQVVTIERPPDYYGIERICHKPVVPKRAKKKRQQYDPKKDEDALCAVVSDFLDDGIPKNAPATLLIYASRLRREHKKVIAFLSDWTGGLGDDLVFMEMNDTAVKVYNTSGDIIDIICRQTVKGRKTAAIDLALQKYITTPYIIILAGNLAGRGVSFVSEDYTRHLTHQYIADPDTINLESAMQSVRLLGRYKDHPELKLYCSQVLFDDLRAQSGDMRSFAKLAKEARADKRPLDDLIVAQRDYTHKWFPVRKERGIAYEHRNSPWTIMIEDHKEENNKHYLYQHVGRNKLRNFARHLMNGTWPGSGGRHALRDKKERVIYCTRLNETLEDFPHIADVQRLYEKFPEYEGKILRKVQTDAPDRFERRIDCENRGGT